MPERAFATIHFAHKCGVSSSISAPAFRHRTHRLSDPSEFGLAVTGAHLAADFLAPQSAPAIIEQFQSPGWALDFHEAEVKARICGPLEPGWASLGLMRGKTESCFHGFAVEPGVLVCNPPGEGIDGQIAPGFECTAVNVPLSLWEQCRELAGVQRSSFGSVVAHRLPPALYANFVHRLRAIRSQLRSARTPEAMFVASLAAKEITTELATLAWQLSAAPESPRRDALRNRTRLARRAETWMRERLADAVQVPDACQALRVSRRELEYAFRWTFDTSPRDFLQALRLNAIRRALQHGDGESETVSRLALDHGITHFGRFSQHYRTLFGESPSETRRQVRHSSQRARRSGGIH
jgi:AraC-like DNA-binding protein